jgi:glycosyltransferase involved in cell wall biosynthesis
MAMRVAVVASDVGAVSEVLQSGKDGYVVSVASVPEIVERVTELQAKPAQLEAMKDAARAKVEKQYSNKILGQNYEKTYKEAAK